MEKRSSKLFVFTGPSGVGKGTILSEFFKKNKNIKFSVSSTTRAPRPNETDGVNYFFINEDEFKKMIEKDAFLEWAKYNGNYYGTSKDFVEATLKNGFDVILEIEVKGALQVIEKIPDCVCVFVAPPDIKELETRLRGRKTETEDSIKKRLDIANKELSEINKYKYVITNDTVENALSALQKIYDSEVNDA